MKALIMSFGLILAFASTNTIAAPVDGQIFYKLPSGDVATRDVVLEVPSRGQGEVILSGSNFEWRTKAFKTIQVKGQTLFIAAFKAEFMNFKSTIIFKGTYLQGSNKLVYYGDFYKKKGHSELSEDLVGFDYEGGFNFSYDR